MTDSRPYRYTIEMDEPVFDIEPLRAYLTDGTFAPNLELANGKIISVQWCKGAYCKPRGVSYGEPQHKTIPMELVDAGLISPVPVELDPYFEEATASFPYLPVGLIHDYIRKAGGVVRLVSHRPIYVDKSFVYISKDLLALREGIDATFGSDYLIMTDRLTRNGDHFTGLNLPDNKSLCLWINNVDGVKVESHDTTTLDSTELAEIEAHLTEEETRIFKFLASQSEFSAIIRRETGLTEFHLADFPDVTITTAVGVMRLKDK